MVTQVSGPLRDVSSSSTRVREAWVVARWPRPQGGGLTTGEPAPATITDGVVSFEALPGPAILRLEKNGEEETHKLLIEGEEQTLEAAARAAQLADERTQSELQRLAAQVMAGVERAENAALDSVAASLVSGRRMVALSSPTSAEIDAALDAMPTGSTVLNLSTGEVWGQ